MKNNLLLLFLLFCVDLSAQTDSMRVVVNDTTVFWHKIKLVKNDTLNGEVRAVYVSDTTRTAFVKNYYNGWATGVYKSFYPNGKTMEKIIYQKGKKNGEYTLYKFDGTVLIKGVYENDIKNGFWIHKGYRIQGRYKNGLKQGKWKWYYAEDKYYLYVFDNGKIVKSISAPPVFLLKDLP